MSIELRKEQNDYIDKILSKGLDEIKNVPSYDLSIISNNSYIKQNDIDNKNKLNLIIPTINDFNISNNINKGNNNKNIFLNKNIEEEKNEIFNHSLNINQNGKEIIDKAIKDNHKNINKLNKYITGHTLSSSNSNYNNKKGDLSSSTRNLIDKYLDMKSSINSKISSKLDKNDSLFKELQDNLFGKSYNNKNKEFKKYNPKSSALKILIEKLKKENEYEEAKNNNSSIQISSFCDSGLFTLGNSNETSLNIDDFKYSKEKKKNKNIRTFENIMNSSSNFNKTNSEIDIFRNRINRISKNNNIKIVPYIKKNYSVKSLNISMIKNKKRKSKSMKSINKYILKEENEYLIKYKQLRKKFDIQREKMKQEKENVILLQQKIKFFQKKLEKYSELLDFNKTLNKQNYILLNNINFSDDVRQKQAKLIVLLQNQIKKLKKL